MKYYFDKKKANAVHKFIEGILINPSQLAIAEAAGYSKEVLNNKILLYEEVIDLHLQHKVAQGRKFSATDKHKAAVKALKGHYLPLKNMAKVLFANDVYGFKILRLKGIREKVYVKMKYQIVDFYSQLLRHDNLLESFAQKGISKEYIAYGMELFEEMVACKRAQDLAESERKEANTVLRTQMKALVRWHADASKIIKAFEKMEIAAIG